MTTKMGFAPITLALDDTGVLLDPTQEITSTTTIQRVLEFEACMAPYIDPTKCVETMISGGYDVMTWTRQQGGGMAVTFGWDHSETEKP